MLGEEYTKGLSQLSTGEASSARVGIAAGSLATLTPPHPKFQTPKGVDGISAKQSHAAVSALFLECARSSVMPESVAEEFGVPEDVAAVASEEKMSAVVRETLSALRMAGPMTRLRDVRWRLDSCLETSEGGKGPHGPQPMFLVQLITEGEGGVRGTVDLCCSVDDLQSLVSKLRDASKQLERSAAQFQ